MPFIYSKLTRHVRTYSVLGCSRWYNYRPWPHPEDQQNKLSVGESTNKEYEENITRMYARILGMHAYKTLLDRWKQLALFQTLFISTWFVQWKTTISLLFFV